MKKAIYFRYFVAAAIIVFIFVQANFLAKDRWKKISSGKIQIVGNTSEKNLKNVFRKVNYLDQLFAETFSNQKIYKNTPINIFIFKNDSIFKNFKPVENGKRQNWVAGFFQPGDDVNYIALSENSNYQNTNRTIFHEYTHSLVDNYFGQENVPPWINEGLAEFFEQTIIKNKRRVILGNQRFSHKKLGKEFQLEPLKTFLKVDYADLRKLSKDEIEDFYAQSWLLIHFIINGSEGVEAEKSKAFLKSMIQGNSPENAYKEHFNKSLNDLEGKLRSYLYLQNYKSKVFEFESTLSDQGNLKSQTLSASETNALFGELLYNMRRFEEAESYLEKSLQQNPRTSLAYTTLGLIKMKLGDFTQSKKYLEKAIENDSENYLTLYRYAYVLSREDIENNGFLRPFRAEKFAKMRDSLHKSMQLNPRFPESFYLQAFINLVQDIDYDESIEMLKKAIQIAPGNFWYQIRLSEFYFKKKEIGRAEKWAKRVAKKANDQDLIDYAERNLRIIDKYRKQLAEKAEFESEPENFIRNAEGLLTEAEQKKIDERLIVEALNQMLRKPKEGEERMVGVLSKIVCSKNGITYLLETEEGEVKFSSPTFENLRFAIFNNILKKEKINCGSSFPDNLVIVTFQPIEDADSEEIGRVLGIEFVPNYFRFPEPVSTLEK